MPCYRPRNAFRRESGVVSFREPPAETSEAVEILKLPCGNCIGCRVRKARDWALRCCLEASLHEDTAFVTLTYDDDHIPPRGLLVKEHLQGWLKRVRERLRVVQLDRRDEFWASGQQGPFPFHPIRFFACGEYGEQTRRPHYHAILFGVRDHPSLSESWDFGFVRVDPCTPASISYVAGYVGKKIGDPQWFPRTQEIWYAPWELDREWRKRTPYYFLSEQELVTEDGQVVEWTKEFRWALRRVSDPHAPFLAMSRKPGLGGALRNEWRQWAESAIWRGRPVPVPRFLHAAWALNASDDEIIELENKKRSEIVARDINRERLLAGEKIAYSLQSIKKESRTL